MIPQQVEDPPIELDHSTLDHGTYACASVKFWGETVKHSTVLLRPVLTVPWGFRGFPKVGVPLVIIH